MTRSARRTTLAASTFSEWSRPSCRWTSSSRTTGPRAFTTTATSTPSSGRKTTFGSKSSPELERRWAGNFRKFPFKNSVTVTDERRKCRKWLNPGTAIRSPFVNGHFWEISRDRFFWRRTMLGKNVWIFYWDTYQGDLSTSYHCQVTRSAKFFRKFY